MSTEMIPLNPSDHEAAALAERARFMPLMRMEDTLERRGILVQAFQKLMKENEDYGTIPGAGTKPTLLQPGAQKLDNLFGLVPRFLIEEREEDWTGESHGGEPFFRYLIKCQLYRAEFLMGEAIGECNSWESKYRYRIVERRCPVCGAAAVIKTRKNAWWCAKFKGGCNVGFPITDERITSQEAGRKPNAEIFDQVNTLLKMAEKRAHVGATINATSASEFVTQDLEDLREAESATPADPGNVAVAGQAAPASTAGAVTRPIPDELVQVFANIDQDPKNIADAFRMMEGYLEERGGKSQYTARIRALRGKYPKGREIPKSAIKDCLMDLFDLGNRIPKPEEFRATDADLPPVF